MLFFKTENRTPFQYVEVRTGFQGTSQYGKDVGEQFFPLRPTLFLPQRDPGMPPIFYQFKSSPFFLEENETLCALIVCVYIYIYSSG